MLKLISYLIIVYYIRNKIYELESKLHTIIVDITSLTHPVLLSSPWLRPACIVKTLGMKPSIHGSMTLVLSRALDIWTTIIRKFTNTPEVHR